jgi:hypothetical protein
LAYLTDNYQIPGVSNFMTGTPNWTALWVPANQLDGGRQWSEVAPAYLGLDSTGKPVVPAIGHPYPGTPDKIRSSGMQAWDVSLFKNIPLPGEQRNRTIQLRCETYNPLSFRFWLEGFRRDSKPAGIQRGKRHGDLRA